MWLVSLARNALVVVLGMTLAYTLRDKDFFKLTGQITGGLPPFKLPPFSTIYENETMSFWKMLEKFGSSIISVPAIAILETIAIAKAFCELINRYSKFSSVFLLSDCIIHFVSCPSEG